MNAFPRIYRPAQSLSYDRYVHLQERLREHRREAIIICEHEATITAGVQARPENLLANETGLSRRGVSLVRIRRGGDFTAHERGQCVIYPHIDLRKRELKIQPFFHGLLESARRAIEVVWDIPVHVREEAPGLYTDDGAKLLSIGIMFKAFFTSYGIALNVSNDLATFRWIHPCGEPGLRVTSVAERGGEPARREMFLQQWFREFAESLELTAPPKITGLS